MNDKDKEMRNFLTKTEREKEAQDKRGKFFFLDIGIYNASWKMRLKIKRWKFFICLGGNRRRGKDLKDQVGEI